MMSEQSLIRNAFTQKHPRRKVVAVKKQRVNHITICFNCLTSFTTRERVWVVQYISPIYKATALLYLCPECAKNILAGKEIKEEKRRNGRQKGHQQGNSVNGDEEHHLSKMVEAFNFYLRKEE